jgi:hypothetical protein
MALSQLAEMSSHVLAATLLMDSHPAPQYARSKPMATRRPKSPRTSWRAAVKRVIRPLVPARVRSKVRLTLVAATPGARYVLDHRGDAQLSTDAPKRAA